VNSPSAFGLVRFFDHIVDTSTVTRAKTDPEIFQCAAVALGADPAGCLGIEEAQAVVATIKSADMAALGIGEVSALQEADAVLPDLASLQAGAFCDVELRVFRQRTGGG
jgi:beta-phosphoglucomutase-like phosphatase (HAD superfamily)